MTETKLRNVIPSERREEAIKILLTDNQEMDYQQKIRMTSQMRRLGRYGTCLYCPDEKGRIYPFRSGQIHSEKCPYTNRDDHWLGIDVLNRD